MSQRIDTAIFDDRFRQASGLTWLPWVGGKYAERPNCEKLLIIGESHYVRPKQEEDLAKVIEDHLNYHAYTRDVVFECLINQEWPNRTLDALPKLLFGRGAIDRERFWSDTAYYNFIQSPMHYNREGSPERPSWDSSVAGWTTFLDVVRVLKPSHCLFIGVEAFKSFNHAMNEKGINHEQVHFPDQVGRTYGRRAALHESSKPLILAGVQHLGKYCSWSRWHDYLRHHHPDLMNFLEAEQYTETDQPEQTPPLGATVL